MLIAWLTYLVFVKSFIIIAWSIFIFILLQAGSTFDRAAEGLVVTVRIRILLHNRWAIVQKDGFVVVNSARVVASESVLVCLLSLVLKLLDC